MQERFKLLSGFFSYDNEWSKNWETHLRKIPNNVVAGITLLRQNIKQKRRGIIVQNLVLEEQFGKQAQIPREGLTWKTMFKEGGKRNVTEFLSPSISKNAMLSFR